MCSPSPLSAFSDACLQAGAVAALRVRTLGQAEYDARFGAGQAELAMLAA